MSKLAPVEIKIINTTPEIVLTKCADGLWRDEYSTIWALPDADNVVDESNVCGVGLFSLPESFKGTRACKVHDYAYSSPAYQRFKTRKYTDTKMLKDLRDNGVHPVVAKAMWVTARIFGIFFWEGSKK